MHFVLSLLNHNIGYVWGICRANRSGRYTINMDYDTIVPHQAQQMPDSRPTTLTARSYISTENINGKYQRKISTKDINERFESEDRIDTTVIHENIERTRFPVPKEEAHHESRRRTADIRPAGSRSAN
ncbi:MAG: hypothetical protein ACNYPE_15685 [Candidatus Azotimanducaceae bacterium WSBS_2022_MAG_OTU7]